MGQDNIPDEAKTSEATEAKTVETSVEKSKNKTDEIKKTWIGSEIKEEHLWDIFKLIYDYEFPAEAIQTTHHPTMKKDIFWYNAQYIINALNEIFGMNHWREYWEMKEEKPATAFVSIYNWTFEVWNWKSRTIKKTNIDGTTEEYEEKYFDPLIRHTTYWGSRNMDHRESLKGAKTNFLKKICSYYSLWWRSYALQLDEDFQNLWIDNEWKQNTNHKSKQQTPQQNKATPPEKKATPPEKKPEEIKMISTAQINFINKLYEEYLEKTGHGDPKTIAELIKPYEVKELKLLTAKQANHFIMKIKEHIKSL